jgi:hypothetical protein
MASCAHKMQHWGCLVGGHSHASGCECSNGGQQRCAYGDINNTIM